MKCILMRVKCINPDMDCENCKVANEAWDLLEDYNEELEKEE